MKRHVATLLLLISALSLAAGPRSADAHAIVVTSNPRANSAVSVGTILISITFNSRIDRARSRLELQGPSRAVVPVPLSENPAGTAEIVGRVVVDQPGKWVIRWQVLAEDGHITRGEIPFKVDNTGS